MCELFAINSRRPVAANAYLKESFTHSHDNPHGWGISWRDDEKQSDPEDSAKLCREPVPAYESEFLPKLLAQPIGSAVWRRISASPSAESNAQRTATPSGTQT